MKLSGVRPSVRPSVCLSSSCPSVYILIRQPRRRYGGFAAVSPVGRGYRSIAARTAGPPATANAVVSR